MVEQIVHLTLGLSALGTLLWIFRVSQKSSQKQIENLSALVSELSAKLMSRDYSQFQVASLPDEPVKKKPFKDTEGDYVGEIE